MLNWLQAKWQQISEFYGDSFVYNVKNMVGTGQGGSQESTKPNHAFRLWERASKARLQKICFNCRTCSTNTEMSLALLSKLWSR